MHFHRAKNWCSDTGKSDHELCSVQTQETILEEYVASVQGAQLNLHDQC